MLTSSERKFAFHTLALAHHAFALKYIHMNLDYSKTTDPRVLEIKEFGPRYITAWNLIMQTIYLFLSIWVDISKYFPQRKTKTIKFVKTCKGYLYTVLVFPTTITVATFFWVTYWINREWVYPEAADAVAPQWLNHCIHTNILIVIAAELLLAKKGLPKPEFKTAVTVVSLFGLIYFTQFFVEYLANKRWIYAIYYDINWPVRCGMVTFTFTAMIVFLKIGFTVNNYITYVRHKQKCQ